MSTNRLLSPTPTPVSVAGPTGIVLAPPLRPVTADQAGALGADPTASAFGVPTLELEAA